MIIATEGADLACLHEYKGMPALFFLWCKPELQITIEKSFSHLQVQVSCKHTCICGLLGVSLLTRTHLAQVQKNTFLQTGVAD